MKRIISLVLILCLLAACAAARAEQPSKGKPFTNPNLYDAFPECPGPEENYYIYANYDSFVRAANGEDPWNNAFAPRAEQYLTQEILEICRTAALCWNSSAGNPPAAAAGSGCVSTTVRRRRADEGAYPGRWSGDISSHASRREAGKYEEEMKQP